MEILNKAGIYLIRCLTNQKVYVGSSTNFRKRKIEHFSTLRTGKHCNPILQSSFNKYGEKCFEFLVIEILENKNILTDRELHWINVYKSFDSKFGFNIKNPVSGTGLSEEGKRKISESKKGISRTEETRTKMREAHKGKILSEEHRAKLSEVQKGKVRSEEQRARMSEAQRISWAKRKQSSE